MIHNRYSLSDLRLLQERINERKNPSHKLIRMINQFHSIERLDGTREEKDWAKKRLRGMIYSQANNVGSHFSNMIGAYLNDENLWNRDRDKFI